MNGSLYAFNGAPTAGNCPTQLAGPVSLLNPGESAPTCNFLGGTNCQTIAPRVGILGTPVISATTLSDGSTGGTIYAVVESTDGTNYYHRLWALDIATLSLTTASKELIDPGQSTGCSTNSNFSKTHIQRPALLLGGDGYLYIAFSMMDGNAKPYPYGALFAFNTASLSTYPRCLALAVSTTNTNDGAGIWGGGGGPAFATDPNDGKYYVFLNTGNGGFDGSTLWGDSFLKISCANSNYCSSPLTVANSYTPGDQYWRSHDQLHYGSNCSKDGDVDLGSGSPMLIPDSENSSYPYLAVSADKEGALWFMDWRTPGGYTNQNHSDPCQNTTSTDANVQIFPISGSFPGGPLTHTNLAFWETGSTEQNSTNYVFVGPAKDGNPNGGELLRYQICPTGKPINNTSPCSSALTYAYAVPGTPLPFLWGVTPAVSASTDVTDPPDALLWAISADGSVLSTKSPFQWTNPHDQEVIKFGASNPGVLYAFDIDTMKKLYGTQDCGNADLIDPATKYSVATVANGYVYLGSLGPEQDPTSTQCQADGTTGGAPYAQCFNVGGFYIFGHFSTPRSCS